MQDRGYSKARTGIRQRPASSLVRVGPLMGIPAVLREHGVDPEPVLASAGITSAQLEDPDTELLYIAASRLLARCKAATGCEHFGLLVGMRADASCLGLPGYLLGSASDVGTALRDLIENLDLHDQGGVGALQVSGKVALLGYSIHQAGVEAADCIYDISTALIYNILRGLCGKSWKPADVFLSRKPPQDLEIYRRFYRAPLRFNADRNAIVFPSIWLDHRLPGANTFLHRHLEQEARRRHVLHNPEIVNELRGQIRNSLQSGGFCIDEIARRLCIHERTLHRRLRDQGTSFRHELESIRYELAKQLLTDSTMSVSKIASMLNYAHLSGFNRAFKRWAGITPCEWRTRYATGKSGLHGN